MENQKFTKIQIEKFYSGKDGDDEKIVDSVILAFFKELIERKRDDPFEDGLQAAIVILPDKFAMKVCENDGKAPHLNTTVNLVKYLNGDDNYLSLFGTTFFSAYSKEMTRIISEGIEVRILDGKEQLMLGITASRDISTKYQLFILRKLFFIAKSLKEMKVYRFLEIGLHTPTEKIEFNDLDEHQFEILMDALINEQERLDGKKSGDKRVYNTFI